MSRRSRMWVFYAGAAGLAVLLVWGLGGLPDVGSFHGRYAEEIERIAVPERVATDIVSTTVFDFRALDTLGEELILFAAAIGVLTVLRRLRDESEVEADPHERSPVAGSRTVRSLAGAAAGAMFVLGLYVVSHGHLTPGGGFQGGIILAGAVLLFYVAGAQSRAGKPMQSLELAHGLGAAGFALIGLGGLLIGTAYLENFVDLGTFARLWSGGTIPLSNVAVGLEVVGATLAIISELLDRRLLGEKEPEE